MIDAVSDFYAHHNANAHRGIYTLGEEATERYEGARATIARFLGAPSPDTIVFTKGVTESINLVANGWGRANLHEGDEVLITEMEHHSNIVPWQMIDGRRPARRCATSRSPTTGCWTCRSSVRCSPSARSCSASPACRTRSARSRRCAS